MEFRLLQHRAAQKQSATSAIGGTGSLAFRFRAGGLHLCGSAAVLTLVWGSLYAGWYRWPAWYLTGVLHVIVIMGAVDLALGPSLTAIVANATKSRRELTRDIGIIVAVQVAALIYGTAALWQGRPLYYAFSSNRVLLVQASELQPNEIALARRENPRFVPKWDSLPRWVWAAPPKDPKATASLFGQTLPRYYRPWSEGIRELRKQLRSVDQQYVFSHSQRVRLRERMQRMGLAVDQPITTFISGSAKKALVVFDPGSMRVRAVLRAD